jgi:lysophospholipase L1-like esterase
VLTIPDWGRSPFGAASGRDLARVSARIDAFNARVQRACADAGVACVDIAPASRACAGHATMFTTDGLHPSPAQYSAWMHEALPAARRCLADGSSR